MSIPNHTQRSCPHCGNNPINHRLSYVSEFFEMGITPVTRYIETFESALFGKLVLFLFYPFISITRIIGLWSYHHDKSRAPSERSRVIWSEAQRRGIQMEGIEVFGRAIEQHRAKVNGRWHHFESLPIPPQYRHHSFARFDSKAQLKEFLSAHHLPTAFGGPITTYEDALKLFRTGTPPFIIKPRSGSRGRHTTTHIYTESDLKRAFDIGKQLSHFLLMEEHLVGSVYRGTYIGGEIVGNLRGDPPRITGDGMASISELIAKKNVSRHPRVREFVMKPESLFFLKRQGYTPDTVLQSGKTIDLTEKVGLSYGGYSEEMIDRTHPEIVRILKTAGDAMGTPIVGFDFIIPDPTRDPKNQKWGIIEANMNPFIDLHHFPLVGTPINAAAKVWDMWGR